MLRTIIKSYLIWISLLTVSLVNQPIEATTNTTRVYTNDISVYSGSSSYIDVYIENASFVAALEVIVNYDPSFIVSGYYQGSLISNELFDLNLSQPGQMRFTFTSVNGINGSGHLFSAHFQVPSDMVLGDYFVTIAIHEAYDIELTPLNVVGSTNKIKVLPKQSTNMSGTISSNVSKNNLKQGDSFTYSLSGYNLNQLVAGEINVNYDQDLLALKSTSLNGHFNLEGSLYSLNDDIQGQLKVAFVFDKFIDYLYPVINIEFEVIQNIETASSITAEIINAYSENLDIITFNMTNQVINIIETADEVDFKNMYTTSYQGSASEAFTIDVMIESNSGLAAGDFVINYNVNHLNVVDVVIGQQVSTNGGIVMYNPVTDQGQIKFTYINEGGLTQDEVLLKITFKPKFDNFNLETAVTIGQTGDVVDSSFNQINLEFIETTFKLFEVKTYHFLNVDGSIYQTIKTDIGASIELPVGPSREGTTFKTWKLQSDVNNIVTYEPTYTLNSGLVDISGLFKIYDGNPIDVEISTLIQGVTHEIKTGNILSVGAHLVEIDIYLDGEYQYTVTKTAYILDSIDEMNLTSKLVIQSYQGYLSNLSETDQAALQLIIDDRIVAYNAWVSSIHLEYELAIKAKMNLNYYRVIAALQFNLNAYYWRRQS